MKLTLILEHDETLSRGKHKASFSTHGKLQAGNNLREKDRKPKTRDRFLSSAMKNIYCFFGYFTFWGLVLWLAIHLTT